jgi:phenylalanyl-tRNA synthetase beta chain
MSEDHDGIIDLPEDAPVGTSFAAYAGLDDPVIEINLTPNRPDCTSIYGIARDLAASGLGTLKAPKDAGLRRSRARPRRTSRSFSTTKASVPASPGGWCAV